MEPIVSFAIILLLMVSAVFLSNLMRTSYVLGYIVAGVLYGLFFHFHKEAIDFIFETAILLLFFFLGLEFSIRKVKPIFSSIIKVSLMDLVLNFSIGFIIGYLLTKELFHSILIGAIFYPSSSIIITKLLELRHRLSNVEAPVIIGTLIFEDIAMIVLIGLIVSFGPHVIFKFLFILLSLVITFLLNVRLRPLLRKLMERIEGYPIEVKTIFFLFLIFSLSAAFKSMEITASLGAFIVGALFADISEKSFEESLGNLKDVFLALFFFFFGYELSHIHLSYNLILPALVLFLFSVLSKVGVFYFSGFRRRTRLRAGLTMVPRGEFSILLAHYIKLPEVKAIVLTFIVLNIFVGTFIADNASSIARFLDRAISASRLLLSKTSSR